MKTWQEKYSSLGLPGDDQQHPILSLSLLLGPPLGGVDNCVTIWVSRILEEASPALQTVTRKSFPTDFFLYQPVSINPLMHKIAEFYWNNYMESSEELLQI